MMMTSRRSTLLCPLCSTQPGRRPGGEDGGGRNFEVDPRSRRYSRRITIGAAISRHRSSRSVLLASALLLLGSALAGAFPHVATAAYPPSAIGRNYAASTDQADATRAALDLMAAGGNAADGAIAAALALGVVSPSQSGMGGGGFALVYTAKDRKVTVLDFRETAPAVYSPEVLWPKKTLKPGEQQKPRWVFTGVNGGVVGVPGEPAGLELLSRKFGKKSLADVAAPAVALAQNGFYVGLHTAHMVESAKDRVQAAPALAAVFLPGSVPVPYAARVRRPDLAATLVRYGAEGKRSIYEGAIAQKIVDAVKAAAGTMTKEDLATYQVRERAPLTRTIDGRTLYTMPAPSAGGLMLLEVLGMYGASGRSELASMGFGSSAYIHTIAEAMRGAFADRARIASDPDLETPSGKAKRGAHEAYESALDPAQLAARKAMILPNKTHAPVEFKTKEKGTTHLVVADAEGNVVALTTTINGAFGANIVPEGTGILLNNELDDFTHPDEVKAFGLADGGPNRPRPRARPVSSMAPTIVLENGEPILALGGSGGTRIATGVTQAALARLVFDYDPSACVSAPRVHTQGSDLLVETEVPIDVRDALTARGESVKEDPVTDSAVQMIAWSRPPGKPARLLAASDPRKAGFSAAR
jgi:gamma-glutamyltranspeptidase/glutathione hydrolase